MTSPKAALRSRVPPPLWARLATAKRAVTRLPDDVSWHLSAKGRLSRERLTALRDKHRGERCFIIGNGPSLRDTDLSLLRDEHTFGLNRIYLMFDELGFSTTYHVTVNSLVIEQCAPEIAEVPCPKFIAWQARHLIDFTPDMMFLVSRDGPKFYTSVADGIWEGATVTYVAMQLAYYLGFHTVILIGVDHAFRTNGEPHSTVVSEGDDRDHFSADYFGKGFRWQLPDLETSEMAYRLARSRFERSGRQVVDATVGGQLDVFPKASYESCFDA